MTESMQKIRSTFPCLRRTEPTAIIHSGGEQTIYQCLCGSKHTTSTQWKGRDAKHVRDWREAHEDCAERIVSRIKEPGVQMFGTVIGIEEGGKFTPFCNVK